jgi:hypothetical protein
MPADDMPSVAYRILRYLDACQRAGARPDDAQLAVDVSHVGYRYYAAVMGDLAEEGYVSGVGVTDAGLVTLSSPRLTLDGAELLAERPMMRRAARGCGAAFEGLVRTLLSRLA